MAALTLLTIAPAQAQHRDPRTPGLAAAVDDWSSLKWMPDCSAARS